MIRNLTLSRTTNTTHPNKQPEPKLNKKKKKKKKMSAPRSGRQSPDPERQPGAQQQDTPGLGKATPNAAPSDQYAQEKSEQTKAGLQSNPEHPLEKAAREKLK